MGNIVGGIFARRALASFHCSAGNSTCTFVKYNTKPILYFLCTANSRSLHVQCSSLSQKQKESAPCIDFTPLCEKPATHESSVEEILKWRRWAQDMAMAVGDKYRLADGGPDSHDLLRELEWMLEDAVSHVAIPGARNKALKCMPDDGFDCFPSAAEQPNSTDCSPLDTETHISPCATALETKKPVLDPGKPQGDTHKSLKWQDIKNFALHYDRRLVHLRASLEDLSLLWTERVQHRRPFQYVVGCAHWRDYMLWVKEGVLIPRPETEQMIDLAEEAIKSQPSLSKGVWADLGTGSGALAIGLAYLLDPQGSVVAVDISNEAISMASMNIQRYGLENKVIILKGSWFSALEDKKGKLAGILSNPPYIPSSHISTLQAEVGQYEPRNALDGGHEGTNDLATICRGAAWALQSDGCIILETNGGGQAEIIAGLLESMPGAPFCNVQLVKDFVGIVRFVRAVHT